MIPHFLDHYSSVVDKIVILDDGSTDRSQALLERNPKVDFRRSQRPPAQSYVLFNTGFFNEAWKESRGVADWVIVGNIDEFLYLADLRSYLARCTSLGVTIVPSIGFEMISRTPVGPDQSLLQAVPNGSFNADLNRLAIFDPMAIKDINYFPGRHHCDPMGHIVLPETERVLNLHFKLIGLERTVKRFREQNSRRNDVERTKGYGWHYGWDRAKFMQHWEHLEQSSLNVLDWSRGARKLPSKPWWHRKGWPRSPRRTVQVIHNLFWRTARRLRGFFLTPSRHSP